jgi:hypothetical protein
LVPCRYLKDDVVMDKVKFTRIKNGKGEWVKLPFKDATSELTLVCTKEDIRGARCGNPKECVLARMLRRVYGPLFYDVCVIATRTHVITKDPFGNLSSTRFGLSTEAEGARTQFDKGDACNVGFVVGQTYTLPVLVERGVGDRPQRDPKSPGGRDTVYNTGKGPQGAKRKPNARPLSLCVVD